MNISELKNKLTELELNGYGNLEIAVFNHNKERYEIVGGLSLGELNEDRDSLKNKSDSPNVVEIYL